MLDPSLQQLAAASTTELWRGLGGVEQLLIGAVGGLLLSGCVKTKQRE